ncbi:MAG TPA: hypothetical protein VE988_11045, partial [Gemmataceae bacterium]|nr:hypothetical protein [Gemmataceae bacterium]
KPISFRMDLYEPLYIPRPLVEPELFASLRPPVYGGTIGAGESEKQTKVELPSQPGFGAAKKGAASGGGKKAGGAQLPQQPTQPPPGDPNFFQQNNKLAYDDMMKRKDALKADMAEAKGKGTAIAGLNYKEGVQSIANSEEVGDYYQYIIDQKISLQRQRSAMLPIINQTIEGSKVSIYNEAVHNKFPLLGIRLKNTSGKPLTQGPITVYDDGSYAGDTRTLDLQPNEERLLSYAVDQGTEVKTTIKTHPAPEMTFNIGGDNLTARYTMRQTKTYTIKNRGTKDRTVILEHPIRSDWKLVDAKQPTERSRDVYRFQVAVKAGQEVKYDVLEDQARIDPVVLAGGKDIPPYYAIGSGIEIKPEVKVESGKLLALSINKGVLHATYKQTESKTYFIQNQSDLDHSFTVDHVIRKDWKRLAAKGKDQVGPDVFRFKVDVKSKQTAKQEVVEEHVYTDNTVISAMEDGTLRKLIVHEAPSAKVKAALQQVLDKQAQLKTLNFELSESKAALKLLTDDQARVRDNLKIIPQTSEHYDAFLKKFVAQEATIEESQRTIRTQEAQLQKSQKEYEAFVTALTVQ